MRSSRQTSLPRKRSILRRASQSNVLRDRVGILETQDNGDTMPGRNISMGCNRRRCDCDAVHVIATGDGSSGCNFQAGEPDWLVADRAERCYDSVRHMVSENSPKITNDAPAAAALRGDTADNTRDISVIAGSRAFSFAESGASCKQGQRRWLGWMRPWIRV